jgi:hypothetical protein
VAGLGVAICTCYYEGKPGLGYHYGTLMAQAFAAGTLTMTGSNTFTGTAAGIRGNLAA